MYWKKHLTNGFRYKNELLQYLNLPTTLGDTKSEQIFRTRVPRGFANRMTPQDPQDPLLLQVLAQIEEQTTTSTFTPDPLHEHQFNLLPGLIHKYPTRVLLTLTGCCAIHCRYCFRRYFSYKQNQLSATHLEKIRTYLSQDQRIQEVIFSGGDPLIAPDSLFKKILQILTPLSHIKTVRIHTRIPIVLPERLTAAWLRLLKKSRFHKVMVLHANHPQELNDEVKQACQKLRDHGFYLLNQSVLLHNINHHVATLKKLSERLFDMGVLPYYLHLLDKVQGAQHFEVPLTQALAIYQALQAQLPGYLVPILVQEIPGQLHKVRL